jgi:hypothetical protein
VKSLPFPSLHDRPADPGGTADEALQLSKRWAATIRTGRARSPWARAAAGT